MSNLTKTLSKEHENILIVINVLEKEAEDLERGKELDRSFLKAAVDFIRNYADKFHHAKEEEILFKELCKDSTQKNMHCNPVGQMLKEHDLGREHVKGIEQGLAENNKKKVIEHILGYASLLKDHIFKEDNILYPMADEVLNEDDKKSILVRFNKVEKDKIKDKEKYLEFIKMIKKNKNDI